MDTQQTAQSIQKLVDFVHSNGNFTQTARGLGINPDEILSCSSSAYAQAHQTNTELNELFASWNALQSGSAAKSQGQQLGEVLVDISQTAQSVQEFRAVALTLESTCNDILGDLSSIIPQLGRQIDAEKAQIESLNQQISDAHARLKQLKEELSGDSGFVKGFLTGLSLGIYNPVKDNIDEQNHLIGSLSAQRMALMSLNNTRQIDVSRLSDGHTMLSSINMLYQSTTTLENTLQSVLVAVQAARSDDERAIDHLDDQAAQIFINRLRRDLDTLCQWQQVFSAAA